MEKISFGKYIELAYKIYVVDDNGNSNQVFEFTADKPDAFIFGADMSMIEQFLRHLEGLEQGADFDFTLAPDEAFGERYPDRVIPVACEEFHRNGEFDTEHVYVGAYVPMQFPDKMIIEGRVIAIDEENVTLDFNHELAGEHVRYHGKVVTVREATPDEVAAIQQHSCGCGCDHDHCGHDHDHNGCEGCSGCGG